MKAISIRLDDRLGREFDRACAAAGYKKNTLLTRLIAAFVRRQRAQGMVPAGNTSDPFDALIGSLSIPVAAAADQEIDAVVYGL